MDFWAYLSSTLPAGAVVNGLGLGALAALFASDRILTKGQHLRDRAARDAAHDAEVAALVKYHEGIDAEKDKAYTRLESANDKLAKSRDVERARADTATNLLSEAAAKVAQLSEHLLTSFDEAKDSTK